MPPTVYWGSTGRHINRNIHHHVGFTVAGGWFVWSDATGEYDVLGSFDCEFIGGKFREPAPSIDYTRVTDVSFHFTGGFTPPPADYLEICALHAEEATNRRGAGLRTQCWVGLGTDGKLRLFRGWTTGQPAGGTLVSTCPIPITMDTASGTASELWNNEVSALLKRTIIRLVVSPTEGRFGVWREDADGVLQQLWCEGGLNTQGDATVTDAITWTMGQRSPDAGVGAAIPPFPSSAVYYWRFQDVVIASEPIGLLRFHTRFANADGAVQDFETVDPNGGGTGPRYQLLRDDPFVDFSPSPDEDFTEVAQDGSSNSDTELVGFQDLPALNTGESVIAVGLSTYMSGTEGNNGTYGFDATARPEIRSGGTTVVAGTRVLYEANDVTNFPDGYLSPGAVESMQGWFGWIPYQDWWSDFNGSPLTSAIVDAMEGGVTTFQRAVQLSQVCLLVVTALPMPSEGNPGGGGGGGGGGGATDALLWPVDAQGRWTPVRTPAPGITDVQPVDAQGRRVPVEAAWVSDDQGRWVPLPMGDDSGDESGDPGDTGSPVVDCITPDFTGAPPPDPLTGRFYGMSRMPISMLGPLFTGTQEGTGGWTPGDITAAGAAASTIVSAQGAYAQFLTGGSWDRSKYEAWITATLAPLASALAAGTAAGSYFGLSMLDDIGSTALWGPGAIPLSDIHDLVPILKAALPGVRIGIRALPSAFPSNFGFDFHTCQFVAWRSQTAAQFAAANVSLCASRSAYAILSLNYLNGGVAPPNPLSSGIRTVNGTILSGRYEMSAAEVALYSTQMMADATVIARAATVAGMLGFQYSGAYLTRPGMIAAMTTARNALAALP